MGTSFLFVCNNCGYEKQSSGKLDRGFEAVVKPYICYDCKELEDILVGHVGQIFEPDNIPDELDPSEFYTCSCGSKNIIEWDTKKRPCPKCGTKMNKSNSEIIMWD